MLCEDRSLLRQSLPAAQLLPRAFRRVAVPRCPSRTPASTRAARRPIVAAVSTLNQQSRPQQTPGRGSALASQPSNDNTHASSFVYTRFHWPTELGGENIFVWGEQGAAAAGREKRFSASTCMGTLVRVHGSSMKHAHGAPHASTQAASMGGPRASSCTGSAKTSPPQWCCCCSQGTTRCAPYVRCICDPLSRCCRHAWPVDAVAHVLDHACNTHARPCAVQVCCGRRVDARAV